MRLIRSATRLTYPTRMEFRKAVKVVTKVSNDHLTPELNLHLITPDSLYRFMDPKYKFPNPHWGFYWPGSQAMSRYIFDNPDVFFNRHVLDIGSGCGACAIAAALTGAASATANDPDPQACEVIAMNSARNHARVHISNKDATAYGYSRTPDIVIVGDVFYCSTFGYFLYNFLKECQEDGVHVFIAGQKVNELMSNSVFLLQEYDVKVGKNEYTQAYVWEM